MSCCTSTGQVRLWQPTRVLLPNSREFSSAWGAVHYEAFGQAMCGVLALQITRVRVNAESWGCARPMLTHFVLLGVNAQRAAL